MRYDFAAYDGDGHLKVLIEAKRRSHTSRDWAAAFRRNLLAHGHTPEAELFVLVLPDRIYTWRAGSAMDAPPDAEIDAAPILAPYFKRAHVDPKTIDAMAFELLVAWWLEDLARQVGPDEQLQRSGLAEALAGGRIARDVAA